MATARHRVFTLPVASVYPLYVQKAERKGRTRREVDRVITWLTGYTASGLAKVLKQGTDFETFFDEAPALHPNASKITGVVCGVRVEDVEDPLMQKIRWLDKLVDELAKGWPLEKVLRSDAEEPTKPSRRAVSASASGSPSRAAAPRRRARARSTRP